MALISRRFSCPVLLSACNMRPKPTGHEASSLFLLQQPQIILLKEGTDTSQGKPQLVSNINACVAVADVVRTTLGPRGMDKLIYDDRVRSTAAVWGLRPTQKHSAACRVGHVCDHLSSRQPGRHPLVPVRR
jgi:hypothetical protein